MLFNNSPDTGSHIITEYQPIIRDWKKVISLIEKLTKMPQSVVGIFLTDHVEVTDCAKPASVG